MAKDNNGEVVFSKDEDKLEYENVIIRYKEKYSFKLHAYCLMDNHIHLLIEVRETPLQKIM